MKLNLLFDNPAGLRNGYINLDPLGGDTYRGDIQNLDSVADDGECNDILAINVLDYFNPEASQRLLQHWTKKLSHSGTLTIAIVDIYRLAKAVISRNVNLQEANLILHGKQEKGWQIRRATLSMGHLTDYLHSCGLKILSKRFDGYNAIVKARRP